MWEWKWMSDSDVVIRVDGLSKAYLLGHKQQHETFFGAMASVVRAPLKNLRNLRRLNTFNLDPNANKDIDILWALKDVSFEVKRGEVLGIIGRNGAGKSTLLKILSRVAAPTRGQIDMLGRVSALLEVGTGFHPELTGRENIYLNGTILGMTKAEIDSKFDEIVDFSGIERFLDTPVKRYSSGMTVRLAFSVAAHLEPEILVVDEVLAVGDAEFQKKCLGKMKDVSEGEGRTVLFVSHNMGAVRSLCDRGIVISAGTLSADCSTGDAIDMYLREGGTSDSKDPFAMDRVDRRGNGPLRFVAGAVRDHSGSEVDSFVSGESLQIELRYECYELASLVQIGLLILNDQGIRVAELGGNMTGFEVRDPASYGVFTCDLPRIPLANGSYFVCISATVDGKLSDVVNSAIVFNVTHSEFFSSNRTYGSSTAAVLLDHTWKHEQRPHETQ